MTTIATGQITPGNPRTIRDHRMVRAGDTVLLGRIRVVNLGDREAGLFLRGDGLIVAAVPIAVAGESVQLELFTFEGSAA